MREKNEISAKIARSKQRHQSLQESKSFTEQLYEAREKSYCSLIEQIFIENPKLREHSTELEKRSL